MMATRRGVLLDRDGTLIDFVRDPELDAVVSAFHPDHIRFLPGVVAGLTALCERGFLMAIATNQPGAAKGQTTVAAIHETNAALCDRLREHGIDVLAVEVCLHHPVGPVHRFGRIDARRESSHIEPDLQLIGPCACRKPAPGMLLSIVKRLDLDASSSWMLGDTADDVHAAKQAGLRSGLLLTGTAVPVKTSRDAPISHPDIVAPSFELLAEQVLLADRARSS